MTIKEKLLKRPVQPIVEPEVVISDPKAANSVSRERLGAPTADGSGAHLVPHVPPPFPTKLERTPAGDIIFARSKRTPFEIEPYEPQRNRKGKFKLGSSGNPGGKDQDWSTYAYEMTGGGQEMIDHALLAQRGSMVARWENDHGVLCERLAPMQAKDQADARKFLWDTARPEMDRRAQARGIEDEYDFSKLTQDERTTVKALLDKARKSQKPTHSTGSSGQDASEGNAPAQASHSPAIPQAVEGEPVEGGGVPRDLSTDSGAPARSDRA